MSTSQDPDHDSPPPSADRPPTGRRGDVDALETQVAGPPPGSTQVGAASPPRSLRGSGPAATDHPTRIGPYFVLGLLGEGGMGLVYHAEQQAPLEREVAIKVIKQGMSTREILARFDAERQALAQLDHPSIAKVLDAGTTSSGQPYFVMELVRGAPITDFAADDRLDLDARLDLFLDVCRAVQHAHDRGFVHRDLKPTNLLVSRDADESRVKVIDFGVAKAIASTEESTPQHTHHGQLLGTLEYMSPEQAEGTLDVDGRSDVYSLGVILYELLVGVLPLVDRRTERVSYSEVQRRLRDSTPERPSTRLARLHDASTRHAERCGTDVSALSRRLRGDLDWIVLRALERDRAARYPTPRALAEDLERHRNHLPIEAGPPRLTTRARKWLRRHRIGAGFGLTLAIGLGAGALLANHDSPTPIVAPRTTPNGPAIRTAEYQGFTLPEPGQLLELMDREEIENEEYLAHYRLLSEFHELQCVLGFTVPWIYAEMFECVRTITSTAELEAIAASGNESDLLRRRLAQKFIDWLREYTPRDPSDPVARRLEHALAEYFERFDRRDEERRVAERAVEQTEEVTTTAPRLDELEHAVEQLRAVPSSSHDSFYLVRRRTAESRYFTALLDRAEQLARAGRAPEADELARRAKAIDPIYRQEAGSQSRLQRLEDTIAGYRTWRAIREEVRRLAALAPGGKESPEVLEQIQRDALAVIDRNVETLPAAVQPRATALRNEIAHNLDGWLAAESELHVLTRSLGGSERSAQMEKVVRFAEASDLESTTEDALHELAQQQFRDGEHVACLVTLDRLRASRATVDPDSPLLLSERPLEAVCLASSGQIWKAQSLFERMEPKDLAAIGPEAVWTAAATHLRTGHIEEARTLLASQPSLLDQVGPNDPPPTEFLLACAEALSESPTLAEEVGIHSLLCRIQPNEPSHWLALMNGHFRLAESNDVAPSRPHYRQSYLAYRSFLERGGRHEDLTLDERARVGRLVAAHEEFLPLRPGATWVYDGSHGTARTVRVEREHVFDAANKYDVEVSSGDRTWNETWFRPKSSAVVVRGSSGRRQVEPPLLTQLPLERETGETTSRGRHQLTVTQTGVTVVTPAGTFENCLVTRSARTRGGSSSTLYTLAPGIGIVRIEDERTGEVLQLVSHSE